VMREQLRPGCSSSGKLIAENLACAAVQSLATALEQVLMSRILPAAPFLTAVSCLVGKIGDVPMVREWRSRASRQVLIW